MSDQKIPQITSMPVKDMKIAPLIRDQPRWSEDDPRYLAFVLDVKQRGIQDPLRVDELGFLWDGFDRLRAAKRAKLQEVPVLLCDSKEGPNIAYGSFMNRKHATKGQRVYAAYPYFKAKHECAKARALEVRQGGGKTVDAAATDSIEAMADGLGVSRDLFLQAAKLHELFAEQPELREEFEPKIMDDDEPISLGGAIAGIRGRQATFESKRAPSKGGQFGLLRDAFKGLTTRLKYYTRFDDEEKEQAALIIQKTVASMPSDLRGEFRRAIAKAEKDQRLQGTEAANG